MVNLVYMFQKLALLPKLCVLYGSDNGQFPS